MSVQRVFLVRHGETDWSLSGQHTGTTDIPLTENCRTLSRYLVPISGEGEVRTNFYEPPSARP